MPYLQRKTVQFLYILLSAVTISAFAGTDLPPEEPLDLEVPADAELVEVAWFYGDNYSHTFYAYGNKIVPKRTGKISLNDPLHIAGCRVGIINSDYWEPVYSHGQVVEIAGEVHHADVKMFLITNRQIRRLDGARPYDIFPADDGGHGMRWMSAKYIHVFGIDEEIPVATGRFGEHFEKARCRINQRLGHNAWDYVKPELMLEHLQK